MCLVITQHCKERYAERIMGRDTRSDIAVYVAQNQEKIEEDINKMATYGEILYTGQLKDKNIVNVILNGTWVLLTDRDNKKAITLYKIDFGLGEEFNKGFIEKMLDKIQNAKTDYLDVLNEIDKERENYQKIIEESTMQINEYKWYINNLTAQIDGYKQIIAAEDAKKAQAENVIKTTIMELVCKKEF